MDGWAAVVAEDVKRSRHERSAFAAVTPDTALRLARFTDTEPEFRLNLQQAVDLWDAMHSDVADEVRQIRPASAA